MIASLGGDLAGVDDFPLLHDNAIGYLIIDAAPDVFETGCVKSGMILARCLPETCGCPR